MISEGIHLLRLAELLDPVERAEYLAQACQGDEKLRGQVDALLKWHEEAGDFLESPALDPNVTLDASPLTEAPGTIIGRYRLLERIGEGGMAVVYMAEQKRPLRRKVALKVIKLGNSHGVRLPKLWLQQLGLGEEAEMELVNERIVITPLRRVRSQWGARFEEMGKNGEDQLLEPGCTTSWDREDWEW